MSEPCGCKLLKVFGEDNTFEIVYCPLHKAAPELLKCLKGLVARIDINGGLGEYKGGPAFIMQYSKEAIAQAEKEAK